MISLAPGEDTSFLLNSLIVVIIGGMGSLGGAAIGALALGLVDAYADVYLVFGDTDLTNYSILVTFALLVGRARGAAARACSGGRHDRVSRAHELARRSPWWSALAALAPLVFTDFFVSVILTKALWLGVAAASLIFLSAYGGMVSLAQVGIYGVAGMTFANLVLADGGIAAAWAPWPATHRRDRSSPPSSGLGFGAIAARSVGIYFLMITLAFSVLVFYFFSQVTELSGFGGVNNVDLPALVGEPGAGPDAACTTRRSSSRVLVFLGLRYVSRTPFGLALQGLRDEPARMRALGFDVTRHRILAFGLAAFVAAIAGVLSVWYNRRITPGSINLAQTIDVLIIAVIGGLYRLEGAWVGALDLRAARQLLARVDARRRRRARARALQHDPRGRLPGDRPALARRPDGPVGARARVLRDAKTGPPGAAATQRRPVPRRRHQLTGGSTEGKRRRDVVRSTTSCWRCWAPARAGPRRAAAATTTTTTAGAETQTAEQRGGGGGTIKVGFLSDCEGAFGSFFEPTLSGFNQALIDKAGAKPAGEKPSDGIDGAKVAGKNIEIVGYGCADDTADKAIEETRRLMEQEDADILVGPLSGDEGIAVANYAKEHPDKTFINGIAGAQDSTLKVQAPNFFRYHPDGAQWSAGLGDYAYNELGWKKAAIIGDDYSFPYTSLAGFVAEYCAIGGQITEAHLGAAGREGLLVLHLADPRGRRRPLRRHRRLGPDQLHQAVRAAARRARHREDDGQRLLGRPARPQGGRQRRWSAARRRR